MSSSYPVYKNKYLEIQLLESSCNFELLVNTCEGEQLESDTLTESQVIDIVVALVGPLHYQNPGPSIMEAVQQRLNAGGY